MPRQSYPNPTLIVWRRRTRFGRWLRCLAQLVMSLAHHHSFLPECRLPPNESLIFYFPIVFLMDSLCCRTNMRPVYLMPGYRSHRVVGRLSTWMTFIAHTISNRALPWYSLCWIFLAVLFLGDDRYANTSREPRITVGIWTRNCMYVRSDSAPALSEFHSIPFLCVPTERCHRHDLLDFRPIYIFLFHTAAPLRHRSSLAPLSPLPAVPLVPGLIALDSYFIFFFFPHLSPHGSLGRAQRHRTTLPSLRFWSCVALFIGADAISPEILAGYSVSL